MEKNPSWRANRGGQGGFSLPEIIIAMLILTYVGYAVYSDIRFMGKHTEVVEDKAFANQKAIQMMEELRSVMSSADFYRSMIDDYTDREPNEILSTRFDVTKHGDPAHPLSGNARRRYYRRVTVSKVPNDPLARTVRVQVFRSGTDEVLAEVVSVLHSMQVSPRSTQVFDVYAIGINNIPVMSLLGSRMSDWWNPLRTFELGGDAFSRSSSGVQFRQRQINVSSYGRDPFYAPQINFSTISTEMDPNMMMAYYYPGMVSGRAESDQSTYFRWDSIHAYRHNEYDTQVSQNIYYWDGRAEDPRLNIADQFNHAMRYPDELELVDPEDPAATLRVFLENLNDKPDLFKNALIVNMHGELLPLPPMRNYSDPAKDPAHHPNVRVVTHPENIRYPDPATDDVKLRVYSYAMPSSGSVDAFSEEDEVNISVVIKNVPNASAVKDDIQVQKMVGMSSAPYFWDSSPAYYETSVVGTSDVLIVLKNSPLRHAQNLGTGQGLASSKRLYGLEYIPCEVEVGDWNDLASSSPGPKNTARWIVTIPSGRLSNGRYRVETRIGANNIGAQDAARPTAVSKTYVWIGESVPWVERYQFMGDPRHMPYKDVKAYHGYNWFFGENLAGYGGFSKASSDLWDGRLNVDVPRFYQLYREGIIKSGAVFANHSAPLVFNYLGFGGEISAVPDQAYEKGMLLKKALYSRTPTNDVIGVDELSDGVNHVAGSPFDLDEKYARVIVSTDHGWASIDWLGELFPDDEYRSWESSGNLKATPREVQSGQRQFYRATRDVVLNLRKTQHRQTWLKGASSFFNGSSDAGPNSYFGQEHSPIAPDCDHDDCSESILTAAGKRVSMDFNVALLNFGDSPVSARRPFRLDHPDTGGRYAPPEWDDPTYSAPQMRTTLALREAYYEPIDLPTDKTAGLIRMRHNTSNVGNVFVSGKSDLTGDGDGVLSYIGMVRGFMAAGAPSVTDDPIIQLPYVNFIAPDPSDEIINPTALNLSWSSLWKRWDAQSYTEDYPADFTSAANFKYNVKYSTDNGNTWFFIQDAPNPLNRVTAHGIFNPDKALNGTSCVWNLSNTAQFPRGKYILRVECYRFSNLFDETPLPHYSFHDRLITISRPIL